jgi:cyclopropane fatty-acyl-phospholipid synthase-like methyltransferase
VRSLIRRRGGRATSRRIHDLLVESLPPLINRRVLDAGWGLGGTMVDLAGRARGDYVGVTLSARQREAGMRAIERAGLADRIRILVQSYDQPPPGPYDVILAIESLAHSREPMKSVAALDRHGHFDMQACSGLLIRQADRSGVR